jgi:hypothetical protein
MKVGMDSAVTAQQQELGRLEAKRAIQAAAGKDVADLDSDIAGERQALAASQKLATGNTVVSSNLDGVPRWLRPFVRNARDNPELASMRVQDAASKYSWLLIPLSVPFMWLLFPFRRRYNTYDHTVFVTYSLSFMMLLVVAGGLLVAAGFPGLASLLFLVPPIHMYRHLKQSYQLGRSSAILRTMALLTFAFIAAGLFLAAAVAIGAT